ncbi:MAG TPA: hypothetical protein PLD55_04295 [bacterium]|nr:hypothetical protein [bacterium]
MDFKEVKEFLEANKDTAEVKAYLAEIEEKVLKSEKAVNEKLEAAKKAVELFKAGEMKTILEAKEKELKKTHLEEFKKIHKIEDKDTKTMEYEERIAALEKEREAEKRAAKLARNKTEVISKLKGFEEIADFFVNEDSEATTKNIDKFLTVAENFAKSRVEEALKKGSYTPPKDGKVPEATEWTEEKWNTATDAEVKEYLANLKK